MEVLVQGITEFFKYKAFVILPIIMLLLAAIARMKLKSALLSAIKIAVGFAGVFVVFEFFVQQIGPVVQAIVQTRGIQLPVVDVGWPPLAAITWSSWIAPLTIPMVLLTNLIMVLTRNTRTLYLDVWNYWHFAFLGVLLQQTGAHIALALLAVVVVTIYTIKVSEWSAPYVQRELGWKGVAISPLSVAGFLPFSVTLNWLLDKIPGLRALDWNPAKKLAADKQNETNSNKVFLLREPMVIGFLVGIFLAVLGSYTFKQTLETAIYLALVMFLLPKCGGLIGEGMGAIAEAFKTRIESKFKKFSNLSIAMDTGILLSHPSVMTTGLILIPVSLLIAFILPGNRVIPLGDLPNLISVMSLTVLIVRGNVIRAVLIGIPIVVSFMLVSSALAELFTKLSSATGMAGIQEGQLITAFTDGGNQVRALLLGAFSGNIIALAIIPVVLLLMWFSWRQHRKLIKETQSAS